MAIQDFTRYLGTCVKFIYHPFGTVEGFSHLYSLVEGNVTSVCVEDDLTKSSFVIDDEVYSFNDVRFISDLPNPIGLS